MKTKFLCSYYVVLSHFSRWPSSTSSLHASSKERQSSLPSWPIFHVFVVLRCRLPPVRFSRPVSVWLTCMKDQVKVVLHWWQHWFPVEVGTSCSPRDISLLDTNLNPRGWRQEFPDTGDNVLEKGAKPEGTGSRPLNNFLIWRSKTCYFFQE